MQDFPVGNRTDCAQCRIQGIVVGGKCTDGNTVTVGQRMEGQFVIDIAVVAD